MELELDEGQSPLLGLLNQVVFSDNLYQRMRVTDIIIYALDDDVKEDTDSATFQRYLHKYFSDKKFMRQLSYYSMVKNNIETSIEYFGQDYISTPDYHFNAEFEELVAIIEKKLAKFLGSVIKALQEGTE